MENIKNVTPAPMLICFIACNIFMFSVVIALFNGLFDWPPISTPNWIVYLCWASVLVFMLSNIVATIIIAYKGFKWLINKIKQ
jgi:hypothetical protein